MKISTILIALGFIGIASGILIFISVFYPVIMVEFDYQLKETQGGLEVKRAIVPKDSEFGIVIPKIAANAKVIPNVDPYNERKYQVALTEGVAHALNTSFPGDPAMFSYLPTPLSTFMRPTVTIASFTFWKS